MLRSVSNHQKRCRGELCTVLRKEVGGWGAGEKDSDEGKVNLAFGYQHLTSILYLLQQTLSPPATKLNIILWSSNSRLCCFIEILLRSFNGRRKDTSTVQAHPTILPPPGTRLPRLPRPLSPGDLCGNAEVRMRLGNPLNHLDCVCKRHWPSSPASIPRTWGPHITFLLCLPNRCALSM